MAKQPETTAGAPGPTTGPPPETRIDLPPDGWRAPIPATDLLAHEYQLIWRERLESPAAYAEKVNEQGQAALCLSGGGIRSAAFGLGVLQALSKAGLLTGFQYLSTVSGGGYIGSWLQRWIHEEGGRADRVMRNLAGAEEPPEIKRLRENSNFITPRVGLGSNDTWTVAAISVRNVVVNWLLFAPLLALVALVPNLYLEGVISIRNAANWSPYVLDALLAGLAISIAAATASMALLLPSYLDVPDKEKQKRYAGDQTLFLRIVVPLLFWSTFATLALAVELLNPEAPTHLSGRLGIGGGNVAFWSLMGMLAGLMIAATLLRGRHAKTFDRDYVVWPVTFAVTTGWILLGAYLFSELYGPQYDGLREALAQTAFGPMWERLPGKTDLAAAMPAFRELLLQRPQHGGWSAVVLTVCGPLWMLMATLIGAIVFSALRKASGPTARCDEDLEWIARVSAVKFKPMLLWLVLAPSVLMFSRLFGGIDPQAADLTAPGLVAVVSGMIAVFGGRSARTSATVGKVARGALKYIPISALIGLATLLFIVALLMLFGSIEFILADWLGDLARNKFAIWLGDLATQGGRDRPGLLDFEVLIHLTIAAMLGMVLLLLGRVILVNKFSLNGLYRNRLARGFLGAARPKEKRSPDPFTGFDAADNIRLHRLMPTTPIPGEGTRIALYPVINVSLNVTASDNLAWQERKAEPFILTPEYCGSGMLAPQAMVPPQRVGCFVPTQSYAGNEPDFGMNEAPSPDGKPKPLGVTLATAMSLSGAAATPNMGYYSSPATAFLMTLFNVRLGAWMPNPACAWDLETGISRSGPKNSIVALLRELAGRTHDKGRDIYLSDGGHFENLGLYEMIRRRCPYIVVSDAAADPKCALKDLGNAVRKVKIDFDVDIEFAELRLAGRDGEYEPPPQLAWALGRITYPERIAVGKGRRKEHLKGWILYLKPSFFGEGMPADVIAYARGSAAFPHESTADQFFSESQFESYRRLADHYLGALLGEMRAMRTRKRRRGAATIEDLFEAAREKKA